MRRDETHCEHGTYIGYPGGPDYLCQWCEDGISVREMREIYRESEERRMRTEADTLNWIYDALRDPQYNVKPEDQIETFTRLCKTYTY